MEIKFKDVYVDKEAENSKCGAVEVFTANRMYDVSESFGKKMVKEELANKVGENKTERKIRNKGGNEDGTE